MTSGDAANRGFALRGCSCELIKPAANAEEERVFFRKEGDEHELERGEMGSFVAEVPEVLGGDEEVVQSILVFLSECAAEADQAL